MTTYFACFWDEDMHPFFKEIANSTKTNALKTARNWAKQANWRLIDVRPSEIKPCGKCGINVQFANDGGTVDGEPRCNMHCKL